MADLHDDEIVSAALDGEADALAAVAARPELRARLDQMIEARDAVASLSYEPSEEVREANIGAALAEFDVLSGLDGIDAAEPEPVPEATSLTAARERKQSRFNILAIGSAAAVVVAAIIGFATLGGGSGSDDVASDAGSQSGDDVAEATTEAASSSPLESAELERSFDLDDSDAAAADMGDGEADAGDSEADAHTAASVEESAINTTEAADEPASTTTTAAAVLVEPVPDEFGACESFLGLPSRPWVRAGVEERLTPGGSAYWHLTIADDTGVIYTVGFEPETCDIVEEPVLVSEG